MIDKKRQLIEELLAHLDGSQGDDLGALLEASKKPAEPLVTPGMDEASPDEESAESRAVEAKESDPMADTAADPMAEKGDNEEMTDDELKEMLQKYLG